MTAFRQIDITRAIEGAQSAGLLVARIEIDPSGKIVIMAESGEPPVSDDPGTAFDAWAAKHAGKT